MADTSYKKKYSTLEEAFNHVQKDVYGKDMRVAICDALAFLNDQYSTTKSYESQIDALDGQITRLNQSKLNIKDYQDGVSEIDDALNRKIQNGDELFKNLLYLNDYTASNKECFSIKDNVISCTNNAISGISLKQTFDIPYVMLEPNIEYSLTVIRTNLEGHASAVDGENVKIRLYESENQIVNNLLPIGTGTVNVTQKFSVNTPILITKCEITGAISGAAASYIVQLERGDSYTNYVKPYSINVGNRITPELFGAKGDGITDDHDALQKAIEFCQRKGFVLYLEPKKYITKAPLICLNGENRSILIKGTSNPNSRATSDPKESDKYLKGSIIHFDTSNYTDTDTNTTPITLLTLPNDNTDVSTATGTNNIIEDVTFTSDSINYFKQDSSGYSLRTYKNNVNGIDDKARTTTYKHVNFYGFSGYGVSPVSHHSFYDCNFKHCSYGIKDPGFDNLIYNAYFSQCMFCVYSTKSINIFMYNSWFDMISSHVIYSKINLGGFITGLVDHIQNSAILVDSMKGLILDLKIHRCGFKGIGTDIADGLPEGVTYAEAVTICASEVKNCSLKLTTWRRSWPDGDHSEQILPTLLCYGKQWTNTTIEVISDADVSGAGSYANVITVLKTLDPSEVLVRDGYGSHIEDGRMHNTIKAHLSETNNLINYTVKDSNPNRIALVMPNAMAGDVYIKIVNNDATYTNEIRASVFASTNNAEEAINIASLKSITSMTSFISSGGLRHIYIYSNDFVAGETYNVFVATRGFV